MTPPRPPKPRDPSSITPLHRRSLLRSITGLGVATAWPVWGQVRQSTSPVRNLTIAQVVDTSASQQDVSRDFLTGARAAWQDINLKGGIRGRQVQHLALEVDSSAASLQGVLDTLRTQPHLVALSGTVGAKTAARLGKLLRENSLAIAHVAPWLQSPETEGDESTFAIFASRQEQIAHALKSLSVMGVPELGVVFASLQDYDNYRNDVERMAMQLKIRMQALPPDGDLKRTGQALHASTPAILLFMGGTPELVQFTQGIEKQNRQRYVVALADVNLQTLMQMGAARNTPIVATQVVPIVTSSQPIVRAYRETLARLFDEPPTPLSLAGFLAARYTHDIMSTIEGSPTRQNTLQAFQRRASVDLGGFRISYNGLQRNNAYVTQSMLTSDGRVIG